MVSHSQEKLESLENAHLWRKATTGEAAKGVWKLGDIKGAERTPSLGPAIAPHETPRPTQVCAGESDAFPGRYTLLRLLVT